uniref:Hydrolase family protein / HAD-superfamily protein n=1 Tax=Cucumis melo TaxID=3656 RepID=A0A9I9E1D1_CUCME
RISPFPSIFLRSFSQISSQFSRPTFGIAFDIDGVLLRGDAPIGGSPQALRKLYDDSGVLMVPFIFLTNGGGFRESKRASDLSEVLGVNISPLQVVQGHSPFKHLVNRYENKLVIAVGKGEPAAVMSEYGFQNVLSIDEHASFFDNIDPLAPYKKWTTIKGANHERTIADLTEKKKICSERVEAAFIVSDSVDWSRDIQVLCDILRTGGLPGREFGNQPDLYFAHDDLEYQAAFPCERFGMGAFRIALESIYNKIHPHALQYTCYGKPNPLVFHNAESVLKLVSSIHQNKVDANAETHHFKTLYMIGDNPSVDINGAIQAGSPWFSIMTRTGVFKGKENHDKYPADLVVDTVEEAVNYIFKKEGIS